MKMAANETTFRNNHLLYVSLNFCHIQSTDLKLGV
jgi:hypothetical protein